jgi:hypothetical protein
MASDTHVTGLTALARLKPWPARLVLAGLLVSLAIAVGVSLSPLAKGYADKPSRGPGDVALYRAEVDRMQAGQGYYEAAGIELRERGYPTRSVFNWRTPLPLWLIGKMPDPVFGKALLCGLAICAVVLCFDWLAREGGPAVAIVGVLLLCGAMLPSFLGDLFVMPVLWAGFLIAISLALLAAGRLKLGVAAGTTALFLRDLAGPFVVVMLGLALCRRRFREAAYWSAGLAAYSLFFVLHIYQVSLVEHAGDRAQEDSWVQLGGLAFVISTTQLNGWLLVLPQWVAALYLPLALLGFAAWRGDGAQRAGIAAAAYVLLFGFVGQDFNQYWGSLIAPLLCLGAAWAAPAVRDLVSASHSQSRGSVQLPEAAAGV